MIVPYTQHPTFSIAQPLLDIELVHNGRTTPISALVDSGATVNVLPYDVGLNLGLVWEEQDKLVDLGGFIRGIFGYAVIVETIVGQFPPMRLAFVWANESTPTLRPILGQVNFFQTFDVCFYGNRNLFELSLKQ